VTTTRRLRNPAPSTVSAILRSPAPRAEPLGRRLRQLLESRLTEVLPTLHGVRHRIDGFTVERDGPGFTTPFAWNARAARRAIGSAAARSVTAGTESDAMSAARAEIDRLCDRALRGLVRRGSLGAWLSGEAGAARALCAVEAATWASGLLHLVEHEGGGVSLGVADAWFDVPGIGLTLHGRRDAVAQSTSQSGGERLGVLRLRDGIPGARATDGLVVDALVDALSAPQRPLPARVIGAWPDAGMCLVVEVDDEAMRHAARVVVACAQRLAEHTEAIAIQPVAA
jgi:hypothetical protein